MSHLAIRQALELKLVSIDPVMPTAFENDDFDTPAEGPYQEAFVMLAEPNNPTQDQDHYRQPGILQVTLRYPLGGGTLIPGKRAELLRDSFPIGLSLTADGVITHIDRTPDIGNGSNVNGRWVIVVRIRFYADVFKGA